MNSFKRDNDGYSAPLITSFNKSDTREEQRFRKVLKMIFQLCEIAGFELVGRVTLADKRTGKVWK